MLIAVYVNGSITVTMAYEDDHFIDSSRQVWNYSFFSNEEIELFQKGICLTHTINLEAIICGF